MAFITTDNQIKKANSSVTVDLSIKSLESFLSAAEDNFRAILGIASFAELEGKAAPIAHLKMCDAIVNMALYFYADSGQLLISDSGMHVSKSDSKLPASDKKIIAFKRGVYRKAWQSFEQSLLFLESDTDGFPIWFASNNRKKYLSSFISFTADFNEASSIQISEDLFQILRSEIRSVERDSIFPLLGETVSDSLKEKLLEGTNLTPLEEKCISKIRLAMAPLAFASSIPYHLINVSPTGVFQVSESALASQSDNIEVRNVPNQRVLQRTMNKLISAGEAELESLRDWMNKNKAGFAGYEEQVLAPMARFNDDLTDSGVYFL